MIIIEIGNKKMLKYEVLQKHNNNYIAQINRYANIRKLFLNEEKSNSHLRLSYTGSRVTGSWQCFGEMLAGFPGFLAFRFQ